MEINNNSNNGLFSVLKNAVFPQKNNSTEISQNNIKNNSSEQLNISNQENLKLMLYSMGINYSEKNLDLIKLLLNCCVPINKQNLNQANANLNLFENFPLQKLEFLIKNDFNINKENAKQLESYIKNETNLLNEIKDLFANVEDKNQLINILKSFNIDNNTSKNILDIFKNFTNIKLEVLYKIEKNEKDLNKIFEILNNKENIDNSNIFKNLDTSNKKENIKNLIDYAMPNKIIFDKKSILKFENTLKQLILKENKSENIFNNLSNSEKKLFSIILKNTDFKIFKDLMPKILNTQKEFAKNIYFDFENSNAEELEQFLNNVKENTNNLKSNFEKNDINNSKLNNSIENINKNLDFMANIKDMNFIQIPLNINNMETNGELFIFKDKKNKNNKNNNSGSVLLSLNLSNLGLLETYINKIDENIFCQFRIKNKDTKKLIENNLNLLTTFLKEKNLNLKEVTFKNIDEKFSLISSDLSQNQIKENISNFNKKV